MRIVLSVIAFGICLVAALIFIMAETSVLRTSAAAVVVAYIAFLFISDWLAAWCNERHVDRNPHLLKNEAIGKTVIASGDFQVREHAASGFVILNGEQWKAHCVGDHVPKAGERMSILARRGLTLVVQPEHRRISPSTRA